MPYAKNSTTPIQLGRGGFIVGGTEVYPEAILPDESLPTLEIGPIGTGGQAFETVLFAGQLVAFQGQGDFVEYANSNLVHGVLVKDATRPFEHGDSEPCLVANRAYVEWPMVVIKDVNDEVVYRNDNISGLIRSDDWGRPAKYNSSTDSDEAVCGRVVFAQPFTSGAKNYPFAGLDKALLPEKGFDRALVEKALSAAGIFGLPAHLSGYEFAAIERIYAGTDVKSVEVVGRMRALISL